MPLDLAYDIQQMDPMLPFLQRHLSKVLDFLILLFLFFIAFLFFHKNTLTFLTYFFFSMLSGQGIYTCLKAYAI